jgi:hypothetical protein
MCWNSCLQKVQGSWSSRRPHCWGRSGGWRLVALCSGPWWRLRLVTPPCVKVQVAHCWCSKLLLDEANIPGHLYALGGEDAVGFGSQLISHHHPRQCSWSSCCHVWLLEKDERLASLGPKGSSCRLDAKKGLIWRDAPVAGWHNVAQDDCCLKGLLP